MRIRHLASHSPFFIPHCSFFIPHPLLPHGARGSKPPPAVHPDDPLRGDHPMTVNDLKNQTIAFAASGGLDSCTITRWLTDEGVRVVCFTADMAQPDEADIDAVRQRMLASGAADFIRLPLHDAIAEAGIEAIQAQACYEGRYWNTTGIGRHVIVSGMLPEMRKRDIRTLSH